MIEQNKTQNNILYQIFKLSRPRFWLYTAGTFLVGFTFGINSLDSFDLEFFLWFFYFLIPANLLIYGINDLADEKIDILNAKKEGKEIIVNNSNRNIVKYSFYVSLIISIISLFFVKDFTSFVVLSLFIFLGIFYSLPPLRFKTKVFLDFISNGFYVLPAVFGFYLISQNLPTFVFIFPSFLWAFSMHLFSAVVDIEADRKAKIQTSATFLGFRKSLIFCSTFWFLAWFLILKNNFLGDFVYLYLIYPLLPLLIIFKPKVDLEKIYWFYPFINMILGFLLFLQALQKIL